ncbi:MAG: hypothetical protein ACFB0B_08355 [Thermonemataceae bacterium]
MKSLRIAGILSLIVVILIGVYTIFGTYSSGERAGVLYKFSKKGVLFKTYEGELNLGYENTGDTPALKIDKFYFSVNANDKETVEQISTHMGQSVTIYYKEKFVAFPWRGDTKYFVYKVEPTTK